MHRGVLRQCITTRQYGSCNFRLSSMFKQLRNFMDGYDMYSERSMYRHLPTQSKYLAGKLEKLRKLRIFGMSIAHLVKRPKFEYMYVFIILKTLLLRRRRKIII